MTETPRTHTLRRWLAVAAWTAVISIFSSIPDLQVKAIGGWDFVLRKIAHAAEFAVLAVLYLRAFATVHQLTPTSRVFWAVFLSTVTAIADELHQHFVPGRCCHPRDVLIDWIGVTLGTWWYLKHTARAARARRLTSGTDAGDHPLNGSAGAGG